MIPAEYDLINEYNASFSPSTLHTRNNALFNYLRRKLLLKIFSVFKFNLPETWSKNYFLYTLFLDGKIAVVNTDKFGVICQGCGLRGFNVFYQPTHAVIVNPLLTGFLEPQIGRQCEIIQLQPDYVGVSDIVNFYADNMAMTIEALEMNTANSKLSFMFGARNKQSAETMKQIMDKIMSGETAVFYDEKIRRKTANGETESPWDVFNQEIRSSFIAPELQDLMRRWEELFCNDVGIANVRSDKKERMIKDEVNSNNQETKSLVEVWFENLREGIEKVNSMFNLNLGVEMRNVNVDKFDGVVQSGQRTVQLVTSTQ